MSFAYNVCVQRCRGAIGKINTIILNWQLTRSQRFYLQRPISHLSWSPDGGSKLAITYCDTSFQKQTSGVSFNSYIWETENPNQPLFMLSPTSASICIEYHQKDTNLLVSGQSNGQCCAWDTRTGSKSIGCTPREICHRESVNSVLWINSKTGTEFFSGGADGQVVWWDTRKLNERLDQLYMDPVKSDEQVLERSYGISVLEYETTIPTRFMVGSEQGMLFFCNRKGKTPMEKIALRVSFSLSLSLYPFLFTFT
jgi:dynein intermediate chain 2, axonemal